MRIDAPLPSDRKFGYTFSLAFGALAIYIWWRGSPRYPVAIVLSALFLVITITKPELLHPLNRAWMALSSVLQRIASPVVLGVLYFVVFTPVAVLMRLFNRDTMHRQFDRAAASYWTPRDPPGPPPESLREQG
jgi:hypothetical protein